MKFALVVILGVFSVYGLTAYSGNTNRLNEKNEEATCCDVSVAVSDSFIDIFAFQPDQKAPNEELFFSVRAKNDHRIRKDEFQQTKRVDEMIENYPSSWISEYRSVELISYHNKNKTSAIGEDNVLTSEQLELIKASEINDEIQVLVKFKTENIVSKRLEDRELIVNMSIVPTKEAEYPGSYENLIAYFALNSKGKVSAKVINEMDPSSISFVVNEVGRTEEVEVTNSCGDKDIDRLFVDLILNMPAWEPAKDEAGNKVKQKLQFNFGLDGC